MERNAAYANLAKWFEYLNDDCDYENWSQYLIEKLRRFPLCEGLDAVTFLAIEIMIEIVSIVAVYHR